MAKAGPTQRTLIECRKRKWLACVVEKWIPQTRRRLDAFGFGDVLAVDDKRGALLIQATAGYSNGAKRVAKIKDECRANALAWLKAGNRIEVWSWIAPSKTIRIWRVKERVIDINMLEGNDEKTKADRK